MPVNRKWHPVASIMMRKGGTMESGKRPPGVTLRLKQDVREALQKLAEREDRSMAYVAERELAIRLKEMGLLDGDE
jgi:hypothetical protein